MRARLLAWACCASLSLPAHAIFSDSEARKQIVDLRAEIARTQAAVNERIDTLGRHQLDFANQLEALRADVARLTGQVELLTHSLEAAHKRQQDFYVDLDARLRKLESAAVPSAPAAAAEAAPAKPSADPQAEMREYEQALGLIRAGKYREAQLALEAFIASWPKSTLLPNATYWLGSSLYQQKQFDKAAELFDKMARQWPQDPKTPDALYARANAQVEAKDVKGAIQTLETLIQKYPNSSAAESARARLKTLAPKKR